MELKALAFCMHYRIGRYFKFCEFDFVYLFYVDAQGRLCVHIDYVEVVDFKMSISYLNFQANFKFIYIGDIE